MSKRKELDSVLPAEDTQRDGEESSDEDMDDVLNVEFEWFDPNPDIDFHGLKTLMRQLFDVDNQLFDLSALSDLILSQPTLGSTVKCEGTDSDPYSFVTVLNLQSHKDKPAVHDLIKYISQKSSTSTALSQLSELLDPTSGAQVGLVLSERFVNMPSEIVPGMYNCLVEEIEWAVEDKEPYEFSHYLIFSKVYTEVESKLDQEENRPSKKKRTNGSVSELFYFHPEDEILHKHAIGNHTFDYSSHSDEGASDSKRTFQELGIKPQGHVILIERKRFEEAIKAVGEYLGGSQ